MGVEKEINNLKARVTAMSVAVMDLYTDSVRALTQNDLELAKKVVERDKEIDAFELEIDERCLKILALYAPKALELRLVVAILRLIIDVERIGDHSKAIVRKLEDCYCGPLLGQLPDFKPLTEIVYKMLTEAFDSFFTMDAGKYEPIVEKDKEVGRLQHNINRALSDLINQDSTNTTGAINLINVGRRLERIADHAKNIAELVPYISSGNVVRHRDKINADLNN